MNVKFFLMDDQGRYLSMDGANEMMVKAVGMAYFWDTAQQAAKVAEMTKTKGLRVVSHVL